MRTLRTAFAMPLVAALLAACGDDGPVTVRVPGGRAELGRVLLARYQCAECHRIPGVAGAQGNRGPALDVIGRASYIAGHIPNYPEAMQRWIADPPSLKPGTTMPYMGVPPGDARDMAAYLYTLR
ncbi:c-type cytochrome [Pseudoduganella sp. LjRoot289]|uniref:c-type cytochrome n=1 Tax=Pseudoduganella sp. LjRoot289 TaxID=3342314 RepID=UPI003ED122FD